MRRPTISAIAVLINPRINPIAICEKTLSILLLACRGFFHSEYPLDPHLLSIDFPGRGRSPDFAGLRSGRPFLISSRGFCWWEQTDLRIGLLEVRSRGLCMCVLFFRTCSRRLWVVNASYFLVFMVVIIRVSVVYALIICILR